jgi:uncharacterized protein with FMN-binding domain
MVYKHLKIFKNVSMALAFMAIIGVSLEIAAENTLRDIDHSEIKIYEIEDGLYIGSSITEDVSATVEVWVEDQMIKSITILEHTTEKGKPAEVIVYDIIEYQTMEVDMVSGATKSSQTILDAVYDALQNQKEDF